jgi:hypothetical protein
MLELFTTAASRFVFAPLCSELCPLEFQSENVFQADLNHFLALRQHTPLPSSGLQATKDFI